MHVCTHLDATRLHRRCRCCLGRHVSCTRAEPRRTSPSAHRTACRRWSRLRPAGVGRDSQGGGWCHTRRGAAHRQASPRWARHGQRTALAPARRAGTTLPRSSARRGSAANTWSWQRWLTWQSRLCAVRMPTRRHGLGSGRPGDSARELVETAACMHAQKRRARWQQVFRRTALHLR